MIIFRIQFCGVFLKITAYPLLRTVQTIFVKSKHIQKEMSSSAAEVRDWLLHVIKEGSKEICYKKVRSINEWHRDPVLLEAKIQELYPDCPRETILTYTNTAECKLIDYTLITNEENMITKIELTFSKLFLYGEEPGSLAMHGISGFY